MAAARPSCDETRYASEFTKASPGKNVRSVRSAAACGSGGEAMRHRTNSALGSLTFYCRHPAEYLRLLRTRVE
jgi:hypothetical protein